MLPLFSRLSGRAAQGRSGSAITLALGIVTLNIGLLLPAAALGHLLRSALMDASTVAGAGAGQTAATTSPAAAALASTSLAELANVPLLGVPLILWRLDNVLLVLVALMMVAARLGVYRPSRHMGFALLIVYAAYFMMSVTMRVS
jgi:hypothetical protein